MLTGKLPPLFIERLGKIFPEADAGGLIETFSFARPVSFRVNTLKTSAEALIPELSRAGLSTQKVSWCPEVYILPRKDLRALQETRAYREGELYVQSLSSLIPVLALSPSPGDNVLDLAAAPGSKTTQIACMMKGTGHLAANDNNRGRFFKLKNTVELQGAENVEFSCKPGECFGKQFPDRFDKVLVDAQCSSEGRFRAGDEASWKFWKPAKIREMSRKQKKLLLSGLSALKPGGSLVYSTCTFAPEENEAVLDWAVRKLAGRAEICEIEFPVPNRTPGLSEWEGKAFHPSVKNAVRIFPDREMEGFFIAKVAKSG
ncbi:MAG TPA: RsmB/NOP family class I SAM-dependent RNA methyltransferase [Candidatus Omnitrophota bacterium]|nr:RsmB/NOP family class I SAM-dependent RNA methyltransferase [Candidatus Omnitrophota bacterium]